MFMPGVLKRSDGLLANSASGHPFYQVTLQKNENNHQRQAGDQRQSAHLAPLNREQTEKFANSHCDRLCNFSTGQDYSKRIFIPGA